MTNIESYLAVGAFLLFAAVVGVFLWAVIRIVLEETK